MGLRFEWDRLKAEANLRKHGVSFEEGKTLFGDPDEMMLEDPDHSVTENRLISVGKAASGEVMLASYTETGTTIRLISVRKATRSERAAYRR